MNEPEENWHWHKARTIQHLHNERGLNVALVSMPALDRVGHGENYVRASKLIAAAPKMLRMLRMIEKTCAGGDETCGLIEKYARAAIAEAS